LENDNPTNAMNKQSEILSQPEDGGSNLKKCFLRMPIWQKTIIAFANDAGGELTLASKMIPVK